MTDPETLRTTFERNAKAVRLRPSTGQGRGVSTVRVRDGTTCEIEGSGWTLSADVGTAQGGNDAGPGPGVLERAALGSCLAIGYATWAAHLDVPIDDIEVEVETQFDARGMHGIDDRPPGFDSIRYHVRIASPASEDDVRRMIEEADAHSPVRDDFSRAIPVERDIEIMTSAGERS